MGVFSHGQKAKKELDVRDVPSGPAEQMANAVAEQLINVGIKGFGTFDSAEKVANKAMEGRSKPEAIRELVSSHAKLAGVNGFLTNVGGFVTMPVALPANVLGFYTLATRLAASIAHVNGHDVNDAAVRSAVLLHLVGEDATTVLKGLGPKLITTPTRLATAGLPPAALAVVNKAVGYRLAAQTGKRLLTRVPRAVPLAGGAVGAVMDVTLLRKIAKAAEDGFSPPHHS